MFQTNIHIFLQSFQSDTLTAIFKFFSFAGSTDVIVPLILIIIFGVHFRSGNILLHLIFWNGIITDFLKNIFALPRPFNVDATVQLPGSALANTTPFTGQGADSFFGALPDHVVDHFRNTGVYVNGVKSFGIPSGHTSNAMAQWGATLLFFKKTWVKVISIIFIIFIPLSRLYLGVHFLADVLTGFLIGALVLFLFYKTVFLNKKLQQIVFQGEKIIKANMATFLLLFYLLVTPFLLLLIPQIEPLAAPSLLGLNTAFLLIWWRGVPVEGGTFGQRSLRVILAILLYFIIHVGLNTLITLLFPTNAWPAIFLFIRQAVTIFLLFWGATVINIKLGLFKTKKNQV